MLKEIAKTLVLAIGIPAACFAWGAGFLVFSFGFQTPGSCFYILTTAFLAGGFGRRFW